MVWNGDTIVDLSREFLASNGAPKHQVVHVEAQHGYTTPWTSGTLSERMHTMLTDLNVASNKGLSERASGVTEGGRTGLTAITTAILFGLSLFLSPIFLAIPSFATAPALVIVGFYMLGAVTDINLSDPTEGIPAFICIAAMPFFYSISEGISMGVISYAVINLLTGNRKKISIVMYILAVLFILKYLLI